MSVVFSTKVKGITAGNSSSICASVKRTINKIINISDFSVLVTATSQPELTITANKLSAAEQAALVGVAKAMLAGLK